MPGATPAQWPVLIPNEVPTPPPLNQSVAQHRTTSPVEAQHGVIRKAAPATLELLEAQPEA